MVRIKQKKKRGRGRPPVPAKDQLSASVTVRFRKDQMQELEQGAKAAGMSLRDYIRHRLFGEDE